MNLKETLTKNIGVKLVALVVALFIWFNASGQQQMTRLRMVPLVIEHLADSLAITGAIPATVEVRVLGTKRQLFTMGFKRIVAVIDLSGAQPGRQRVSLSASSLRIPSGIERRNVTVISPTSVDMHLERMTSRRVPVALSTSGALGAALVVLDDGLALTPSWITVSGPGSTVDRIRSIPTATFDLGRVKESRNETLALDYDDGLIDCDPNTVTLSIRVSPKATRVIPNVPPTVLVDSDDIDAVVLPNTVSLTLEGAAAILDTLSSGDITVLLDLSGRVPARYTLAPEIILPSGVSVAGMSVDSLVVNLTRARPAGAP